MLQEFELVREKNEVWRRVKLADYASSKYPLSFELGSRKVCKYG